MYVIKVSGIPNAAKEEVAALVKKIEESKRAAWPTLGFEVTNDGVADPAPAAEAQTITAADVGTIPAELMQPAAQVAKVPGVAVEVKAGGN